MDNSKVQKATTELKLFCEKKKLKISETKEVVFRLIDYIDSHYADDEDRDVFFKNGDSHGSQKFNFYRPRKQEKRRKPDGICSKLN